MAKQAAPVRRCGSLLRMLKVDMQRAVCSPRFLLSVLMMLASMVSNSFNLWHYPSAPYILEMAVTGDLYLGPVILAIATVPYASSYITERDCGFQRQAVERVGITAYSVSKVLATALSAFLMAVAAMGIFLAALCVRKLPHTGYGTTSGDLDLLLTKPMGPFLYYGVWFIFIGLKCGLCAVFALLVTCWLPNAYVCLLAPMITLPIITAIFRSLTACVWPVSPELAYVLNLLNPDTTFSFLPTSKQLWFNVLWPVTVFCTETALCGWTFVRKQRKGQNI